MSESTSTSCAACGAPNALGAHFCVSCGHALARTSGMSMEVCSSCGVVRPERKTKCGHCNVDHGVTALTLPRSDSDFWVCIECSFQCRACGFSVPLNHLDMDGGVLCARCGLEQAFDVSQWRPALGHSHAIAEMFGLHIQGLASDISDIGKKQCSVKQSVGGSNAFEITSSPGFPLCTKCHAALSISITETGETKVACAACKTEESYRVPVTAKKMTHGALKAIIAAEHRADRAAVTVEQTPGAIAIKCPQCSAPLPASDASKFVKCSFCDTVSRIPDHTWFRMSGKAPENEPMWLLFHGRSDVHKELEGRAKKRADDEKRHEETERNRALYREERAQKEAERDQKKEQDTRERREREEREKAEEEDARAKQRAADSRTYTILVIGGLLLIAGGIALAVHFEDGTKKASTKTQPTNSADAGRLGKIAPPPRPPDVSIVPGCLCTTRDTSTKNTFVLEAPAASHVWRFDWTQKAGFVETESTMRIFPGDAGSKILPAPSNTSTSVRLGIACDGATVMLVSGKIASGWFGSGGEWSTTLPGTFTPKVAPASAASGNLDVACTAPLPVEDGLVALTLDNGKHVRLAMKDGRLK